MSWILPSLWGVTWWPLGLPRTLEERIELGWDWEQWLVSVEGVEEEERLVAEAKETAKAWVDSLVGDVDIAPK